MFAPWGARIEGIPSVAQLLQPLLRWVEAVHHALFQISKEARGGVLGSAVLTIFRDDLNDRKLDRLAPRLETAAMRLARVCLDPGGALAGDLLRIELFEFSNRRRSVVAYCHGAIGGRERSS